VAQCIKESNVKNKSDDSKRSNLATGQYGRRKFIAAATAAVAATPALLKAQVPAKLGAPMSPYGERSPYEKSARISNSPLKTTGASLTPLQDLNGTITPSSLHYERHHSGVPTIDPATHELLIHGLVERPLVFKLDDLKRLPSVSRTHFLECAGNSTGEHLGQLGGTPQLSAGLVSCSEWTGVAVSTLFKEAGVKPQARWVLAEGADASRLARSVPLAKAMDDGMVAYSQNGEAVRPEQGYPLRLILPGWEGNINIKWLRRMELIDQPAMTRDEAAFYTDLLPSGKARQFGVMMEAKSIITRPSGGQHLPTPGYYEITGIAWSGRARVTAVEVSTDGGTSWKTAELQEPVLDHSLIRFRLPWIWDGKPALIGSRCIDASGYVQPKREELVAVRGLAAYHHHNGIKWWSLLPNGDLSHA
jgi:sulfane dehydrogenase subunit SoxC